ncbi:hypothetical protein DFH06DRAFT_310807 [Mycena polygramma]|nr:hypothetical protein DFH06DRAFT_310807 [Mycena polygramma]
MSSRTVFFRPPPFADESVGMEWIPCSQTSRPFHPDYEKIPLAATVEREFQCSKTLESHLFEFYQIVKPLLVVPSFDSASPCTLYAEYLADQKQTTRDRENIADFRGQTMCGLVAYFRALPPQTARLVATNLMHMDPGLDDTTLAKRLMIAHIFSMQSELIELRVWMAVCSELFIYEREWNIYVRELQSCHPPDHRCPRPIRGLDSGFYCIATGYDLGSGTSADTSEVSFNQAVYPGSRLVRRRSRRPSLGAEL